MDIIEASRNGNIDIVKEIISTGADVNEVGADGDTALIWASFYGHTAIVKELINKGADINYTDNTGNTALIEASCNGRTEIVKDLLKAGAIVIPNIHGQTALKLASQNGYTDIIKFIKEQMIKDFSFLPLSLCTLLWNTHKTRPHFNQRTLNASERPQKTFEITNDI